MDQLNAAPESDLILIPGFFMFIKENKYSLTDRQQVAYNVKNGFLTEAEDDMLKVPENKQYVLYGGTFVLANKLQWVADKRVAGLTSKQWFLLRTLKDMPAEPEVTITALAMETDTTRQNVTKMLDVLCREGCVNLTDHPADHRSRVVTLTGYGQEMLTYMREEADDFFTELFDGIGKDECEAAAEVVLKMISNLNKMQEELV